VAGAVLLAGFVGQMALGFEWASLARLQASVTYKAVSGGALVLFIGSQWLLSVTRVQRWMRSAKALYTFHQVAGSAGPLLLFAHSTRLGYGYLTALGIVFLLNHALALASPAAFPRLKSWSNAWLTSHIALSVVLVALGGYHAWAALYYE
jgi:methionine sulfoxide reductase heme-binding subunit